MPKQVLVSTVVAAAAFAVLVLTPVGPAISQEMTEVLVRNFPDPQSIEGKVTVEGPIRTGELVTFADITVSPVRPEDTTRLINAGLLDADGFQHVVLSLVGQTRGETLKTGTVGAILLPDQAPIHRAFHEDGAVLVPLRVTAQTEAGPPAPFGSDAVRQTLAFPTYQVLLYNTTDKTVNITLYAYLTSG